MKHLRILFLLLFFCSCLQAKKSPFDVSSPSGFIGVGGFQFFFGNSSTDTGNSSSASIPPTVTALSTAGGGTGVQFTFSKTMDPSSITVSSGTGVFQMLGSDAVYLNGTITTSDNKTFVFRSSAALTVNLAYTIKILKSAKDSTGLTMNEDYTHTSSIKVHAFLTSWGSSGAATGQFNKIPGVAVNSSLNTVYMTDNQNSRVQSYNQNTSTFNVLLTGYTNPFGITVDSAGYFYFSQAISGTGRVFKIDPSNSSSPCSTTATLNAPRGIAIASNGIVYVAEKNANAVNKYDFPTCSGPGTSASQTGTFAAGLTNDVSGIAIDSSNNVYVTLESGNQVKKFDSNGNLLLFWGTAGSGNNQFASPVGIAVDSSGYLYVADYSNNRIQKFDSSGNYILSFTTGSAGAFSQPAGVAIDSSGNVYVGDQSNHRVQKFGPP